jgi:uncharacterized membrane protein YhdT
MSSLAESCSIQSYQSTKVHILSFINESFNQTFTLPTMSYDVLPDERALWQTSNRLVDPCFLRRLSDQLIQSHIHWNVILLTFPCLVPTDFLHCSASTALVPGRSSGTRKSIVWTFALTVLFVAVTSVIVFAKGTDHFMRGFIFVGVALVLLFISTAFLLNFVRTDDTLDDKVRRFAVFQSLSLLLLCISILVVVFEPAPPGETCAPASTCDLTQAAANGCVAAPNPGCFTNTTMVQPAYFHVNTTCSCSFLTTFPQCQRRWIDWVSTHHVCTVDYQ